MWVGSLEDASLLWAALLCCLLSFCSCLVLLWYAFFRLGVAKEHPAGLVCCIAVCDAISALAFAFLFAGFLLHLYRNPSATGTFHGPHSFSAMSIVQNLRIVLSVVWDIEIVYKVRQPLGRAPRRRLGVYLFLVVAAPAAYLSFPGRHLGWSFDWMGPPPGSARPGYWRFRHGGARDQPYWVILGGVQVLASTAAAAWIWEKRCAVQHAPDPDDQRAQSVSTLTWYLIYPLINIAGPVLVGGIMMTQSRDGTDVYSDAPWRAGARLRSFVCIIVIAAQGFGVASCRFFEWRFAVVGPLDQALRGMLGAGLGVANDSINSWLVTLMQYVVSYLRAETQRSFGLDDDDLLQQAPITFFGGGDDSAYVWQVQPEKCRWLRRQFHFRLPPGFDVAPGMLRRTSAGSGAFFIFCDAAGLCIKIEASASLAKQLNRFLGGGPGDGYVGHVRRTQRDNDLYAPIYGGFSFRAYGHGAVSVVIMGRLTGAAATEKWAQVPPHLWPDALKVKFELPNGPDDALNFYKEVETVGEARRRGRNIQDDMRAGALRLQAVKPYDIKGLETKGDEQHFQQLLGETPAMAASVARWLPPLEASLELAQRAGVTDLSVLCYVEPQGVLKPYLIDFLQPYNRWKKIEHCVKACLRRLAGRPPSGVTVQPPDKYCGRLLGFWRALCQQPGARGPGEALLA